MQNLQQFILKYLDFCKYQKTLNEKSLKAYRIDLTQYADYMAANTDMQLNRINITSYITNLHKYYKPKSAKRKIASLKAFFSYLDKYPTKLATLMLGGISANICTWSGHISASAI